MDNVFTYRSTKTAALNEDVELYPHQVDAIEFLKKNRKGVIAHGTGMGKTLTSIAAFERLKQDGLANRAIVVVPASLRDNFAGNISKYTDSKYTIYGPKNDKYSTNVDVPSTTPYNIISYDLYRKDPEGIRKRLGADTLIIDESHRARNKNTSTYKQLSDTSKMYSNIVSLTGSLVNNEPSDIVPLLDISHGKGKNPITGRSDFNRRFVAPKPKKRKGLNPRDEFTIVNRKELSNLLKDKVHYVSHRDVERSLPAIEEEVIRTEMTPLQKDLYLYAIESLDPATRRKIERNVPVSQKEMAGIFAYLIKARKVLTDPSKMYDKLEGQDPYEYSPKIKRVVDDLSAHMAESDANRSVIYGNLVNSQLKAVESALSSRGIEYATFYGTGNEGNSATERQQAVSDYLSGKKRILLVSGAGAEGLDLKGSTMLQMLEGHYNPEKIQQATARVRRMGDTPDKPILIKKYVSVMPRTTVHKIFGPLGVKPQTSIDEYIYTAAKRKDDLNEEFRMSLPRKNYGTLKTANINTGGIMNKVKNGLGWYTDAVTGRNTAKRTAQFAKDISERGEVIDSLDDSISSLSKRKPLFFKSRHANKINDLSNQRAEVLNDIDSITDAALKDGEKLKGDTLVARGFTGAAGLYGIGAAGSHLQKKQNEMAAAEGEMFSNNIMKYRDSYIANQNQEKYASSAEVSSVHDPLGDDRNIWRSEARNSGELIGVVSGLLTGGVAGGIIAGAPHSRILKKYAPKVHSSMKDYMLKNPELYGKLKKTLPIARYAVPAALAASWGSTGRRYGREIGDASWAVNRIQSGVGNGILNIPQKNKSSNNSYASSAVGAATMGAVTSGLGTLAKSRLFKVPAGGKSYATNMLIGSGVGAAMGVANNALLRGRRGVGRAMASGDTYVTRNE